MNYSLSLVTAPSKEPIQVNEVKHALRISHSRDDSLIESYITVARINAEAFTRRAFMTQTWQMFMDSFTGYSENYPWWTGPGDNIIRNLIEPNCIEIPQAPLQSVTHLKTYDDSDLATTFSSSSYYVSTYSGPSARPGSITLRESDTWPTFDRVKDGIEIQFVAGYGSNASDVPRQIRTAIQEEAIFLYNNRGACSGSTVFSPTAKALLSPFKVMKI